tara:strand:- start:20083 stop:21765 length:1683 start_codon:yes stop_codon:yes gene_type:complete
MINTMVFLFFNLFLSSIFLISAGYQLNKISKFQIQLNTVESGLFGFIYLGFISLFLNFFLPLSKNLNTTIFLLVIVFFIFQNKNKLREILEISITSLKISFIAIIFVAFSSNFDPDAFLYHLPYSNIVNDYKILSGSSLLHFRFGHVSILQYINAFFNNYIFGTHGIIIPISLAFSFFLLYLINQISKILRNDNYYNLHNFFIVSSLIFICLRMNRYSDYGNDNVATIFFLYFISFFIRNFETNTLYFKNKISLLASFIFTIKVFYFVPLILSFYLWISKKNFKIINLSNVICVFFLFLWFLKNILISGCAVYPASFTCINKLPWYNTENRSFIDANQISLESEAWAKNWNTYNKKQIGLGKNIDKIESQKNYVKKFFWFKEWSNVHGLVILKKITPFLILILILLILERKRVYKSKKKGNNKLFKILLITNLIALLLWFIKFPIMRYGLAYIFIQFFLVSYLFIKNKYFSKLKYIIVLSIFVLFSKNLIKIYNNFDKNIYPIIYKQTTYYEKNEDDFVIYYTKNNELCGYKKSPCTNYEQNIKNLEVKKFLNYRFFSLK